VLLTVDTLYKEKLSKIPAASTVSLKIQVAGSLDILNLIMLN
jgi:hypothetical protein